MRDPNRYTVNPEYKGYGNYFILNKDPWTDVQNGVKNKRNGVKQNAWKDAQTKTSFPIMFGDDAEDDEDDSSEDDDAKSKSDDGYVGDGDYNDGGCVWRKKNRSDDVTIRRCQNENERRSSYLPFSQNMKGGCDVCASSRSYCPLSASVCFRCHGTTKDDSSVEDTNLEDNEHERPQEDEEDSGHCQPYDETNKTDKATVDISEESSIEDISGDDVEYVTSEEENFNGDFNDDDSEYIPSGEENSGDETKKVNSI